ncbi:MAG: HPr kinase/phosphatase C-terminal domain-containing protein [Hyphomicrobium sp.]
MPGAHELVHATAIALGGRAALIRGASGAGKSDLALRCLSAGTSALVPLEASLVADDQVCLARTPAGRITASAPATIEGQLEVRGLGIVAVPAAGPADLVLVVDLVSQSEVERYPITASTATLLGVELPLLRLSPFEASAHAKLLLALYLPRSLRDP